MRSGGLSGAPLVSGRWLLETFHPLDERVEEPAHALSCLLVGQVARLHVELLASVGDEHLGLRHDVGGGVQEDLAEHHLAPRRSRPAPARLPGGPRAGGAVGVGRWGSGATRAGAGGRIWRSTSWPRAVPAPPRLASRMPTGLWRMGEG